jgi:methionine-rich copper-binding protein CopC
MIRETLTTDSKHAMCALTPGNGFAMQWRTNTNDWTDNKDTAGIAPGWVKMERIGNVFTSYFSLDGINWNTLQTSTINMVDTVYVGLANCSHIDTAINDAIFDQITFNGKTLNVTESIKNEQTISIFPNPFNNELHLNFNQVQKNDWIHVKLYDLTSKTVFDKSIRNNGTKSLEINLADLKSGIYFVEINADQKHISKIIKQ